MTSTLLALLVVVVATAAARGVTDGVDATAAQSDGAEPTPAAVGREACITDVNAPVSSSVRVVKVGTEAVGLDWAEIRIGLRQGVDGWVVSELSLTAWGGP